MDTSQEEINLFFQFGKLQLNAKTISDLTEGKNSVDEIQECIDGDSILGLSYRKGYAHTVYDVKNALLFAAKEGSSFAIKEALKVFCSINTEAPSESTTINQMLVFPMDVIPKSLTLPAEIDSNLPLENYQIEDTSLE